MVSVLGKLCCKVWVCTEDVQHLLDFFSGPPVVLRRRLLMPAAVGVALLLWITALRLPLPGFWAQRGRRVVKPQRLRLVPV